MNNLTIVNQELPAFLQSAGVSELTKQLAGKTGTKRIVPKNGIFRKVVGTEEMGKVKGSLNVIVINASPKVGRIFYAKPWTPDAEPTAPDCFSNDGNRPDEGSASPQAERCDSCPQNIKGSGQGNSKACRYSRRIAVNLEEDMGTTLEGSIYQMNLASKSLFGETSQDNAFTFENYTKYLANNGKSLDYVVTQLSFNEDNDNQSILFTPTRFINQAEHLVTSKAAGTPEAKKLVVMTPFQAEAAGKPALANSKPAAVATKDEDASEEEIAEPVKRPSKPSPAPVSKGSLDDVVKAWSDD